MNLVVGGRRVYAYTGTRELVPGAPTVVFVHGAANDHSVWALQSRYFAYHGRNVLALDLPGHGASEGDPHESVEAIADWLPAFLDAAGIGKAALVGHSLGSLAVLEAAARHPARVERVALLGPAVPMAVSEALLTAARDDPQRAYEMIVGWSHAPARQLGGNPVPGWWMTGMAMRLLERSRPGVLHTDLVACNGHATGLEAARRVRCPALAIVGTRDLMAPPRAAQALLEALEAPHLVTLEGAGHALMAERPDDVLDALREFLA